MFGFVEKGWPCCLPSLLDFKARGSAAHPSKALHRFHLDASDSPHQYRNLHLLLKGAVMWSVLWTMGFFTVPSSNSGMVFLRLYSSTLHNSPDRCGPLPVEKQSRF